MPRSRKSPRRNIPAAEVVAFLDAHATISVDLDRTRRSYINGVWVDPVHKREIRRYRNGQVRSLRPESLEQLLQYFNLKESWPTRSPAPRS